MHIETRHYINLDEADKELIVKNAREVDESISALEFIDYIEALMNEVVDLAINANT